MAVRTSTFLLCLTFLAILAVLTGCGHKYEDEQTGITIRELGSDLDNRWSFRGVVVDSVKPGSRADGLISTGELISHIVDERQVKTKKEYTKALSAALDKDGAAALRILKTISADAPENVGITVRSDPDERGVIASIVKFGKRAEASGIKLNTIIYQVNGKKVKSVEGYESALAEALASSDKFTLGIGREVVAPNLRKLGIDEVEEVSGGVVVKKLNEEKSGAMPAAMEGIMVGDVITHVIDEMKITNIKTYKKAIKKASNADRVVFERGELGGIKLVVIEALGQIGDKRALESLLKMLDSKDRWIRRAAAVALEGMDDERLIEPLMSHMLEISEPDVEVRRSCARALARMEPLQAIEALAQALKDSSLGVRLEAGYALGRIGEPAIDVLIKARYDEDSRVRDSAVSALGDIGGALARKEISSVLEDEDEEQTVKLTAIQALYKLGDTESYSELRKVAQTGDPGLQAFVKELLSEESI